MTDKINGFEWLGRIDSRPSARGEAGRFECKIIRTLPAHWSILIYEREGNCRAEVFQGREPTLKLAKQRADSELAAIMGARGWYWVRDGGFRILCTPQRD